MASFLQRRNFWVESDILDGYRHGQGFLIPPASVTSEELYRAYFGCIRHKRNSRSALEFRLEEERNLFELLDEINTFSYRPRPYSVFIIDRPVKREVFAASFRDRIVHHLVVDAINPYIERRLIYDCYACRVGKGTHFGIERLRHFMASSTNNWKDEAWCLKLDIRGFFMSIDRSVLWNGLRTYLIGAYGNSNLPVIMDLLETIVFTDPTKDCLLRSPSSKWEGLPHSKSLFFAEPGRGLPIGNLTSQILANFYMSSLDHFVKHDLGISMYGRYVDDFFLIHRDRNRLKECLAAIKDFLFTELRLELNPSKVRLQPVDRGVRFLGVVVEPGHTNMARRTVSNFYDRIATINAKVIDHRPGKAEMKKGIACINSYLGLLSHFDTYRLRGRVLDRLDSRFAKRICKDRLLRKISFVS